jgi:hypothetical protein
MEAVEAATIRHKFLPFFLKNLPDRFASDLGMAIDLGISDTFVELSSNCAWHRREVRGRLSQGPGRSCPYAPTVNLNLSAFQTDYDSARIDHCVPKTFCNWNGSAYVGAANPIIGKDLTPEERNVACSYAGKDIDCPTGGCAGFSITLPEGFVANDQTTANNSALVTGLAQCFPKAAPGTSHRRRPTATLQALASRHQSRRIFAGDVISGGLRMRLGGVAGRRMIRRAGFRT